MKRHNPSPGSSWIESIEYRQLKASDRVRGGRQKVVWLLSWIDAAEDAPAGTRASLYSIYREFSGLIFNERFITTVFSRTPVESRVFNHSVSPSWISQGGSEYTVSVMPGKEPLEDDGMRAVGLHGYQVLLTMLDRLRELDAISRKRT